MIRKGLHNETLSIYINNVSNLYLLTQKYTHTVKRKQDYAIRLTAGMSHLKKIREMSGKTYTKMLLTAVRAGYLFSPCAFLF